MQTAGHKPHGVPIRDTSRLTACPLPLAAAPSVIPGQLSLSLPAAGYRETDDAWLAGMLTTYGAGFEGVR